MPQLVPWSSSQEWFYVRDLIFSWDTDLSCRSNGLKRLQMWKGRTPNLPCGVEGTRLILNALSKPLEYETKTMAVLKFLNQCVCGRSKQGTFTKTATSSGIPKWLIALRHEIAHGEANISEELLDLALDVCLQWVKDHYWFETADEIVDIKSNSNACEVELCELFELYIEYNIVRWKRLSKTPSFKEKSKRILGNISENDFDFILHTIADKMNTLLRHIQTTSWISEGLKNSGIFSVNIYSEHLSSKKFWRSWQELINVLCIKNLILELIKCLLINFNNKDSELAGVWINHLFVSLSSKKIASEAVFLLKSKSVIVSQIKELKTLVAYKFGKAELPFLSAYCKLMNISESDFETFTNSEKDSAHEIVQDVSHCAEIFDVNVNELQERPKKRTRIVTDFSELNCWSPDFFSFTEK